MAKLILMVGIPSSGKSVWAKNYAEENENVIVHSGESVRKTVFGDRATFSGQSDEDIDILLQQKVLDDLRAGMTVIYDARNIRTKQRKDLLYFFCTCVENLETEAVYVKASLDKAIFNNQKREVLEKAPNNLIENMWKYLSAPQISEGWDTISVVRS